MPIDKKRAEANPRAKPPDFPVITKDNLSSGSTKNQAALKNEFPLGQAGKKPNMIMKVVLGSILGLVIVIIIFFAVMGVGIYRYHWNNALTKSVLGWLPYPAVMMDGELLGYQVSLDDVATLN